MRLDVLGINAADATAWATIALAVVGIAGIGTGIALAIGTLRAAQAARDATTLQQRQADLLERELKLVEQQAFDAREIAWPKLRVSVFSAALRTEGVVLHYVQGTLPATDIQVWVRYQPEGESGWGLYFGWVGYMSKGEKFPLTLTKATDREQEHSPFQEFFSETPGPVEFFVGLIWKGTDGIEHRRAERHFLNGRPVEPFARSSPDA